MSTAVAIIIAIAVLLLIAVFAISVLPPRKRGEPRLKA